MATNGIWETVLAYPTTVPRIVWKLLRRQPGAVSMNTDDYVGMVWTANPGLAALGPFLPVGTKIFLPLDIIPEPADTVNEVIRLWD